MQVSTTINRNQLRAALLCAGSADIRFYLNGVHVEVYADRVFLASTDGHRLAVFRNECGGDEAAGAAGVRFTIPYATVKAIKANKRLPNVGVLYDTETEMVTIEDFETRLTVKAVGGTFPDWRRVIPAETSREVSQFNPQYVADFGKIAELLGSKFGLMHISHNGNGAALVTVLGHPEFIGVLMPVRSDAPVVNVSSFKDTPASEAAAAAAAEKAAAEAAAHVEASEPAAVPVLDIPAIIAPQDQQAAPVEPDPDAPVVTPARHAHQKFAVRCASKDGFKTRAARLAEHCKGKYSNRERAYIMSAQQVRRLQALHAAGRDANSFTGELVPEFKQAA